MLRTIILFLIAAGLTAACSDTNERPDVIPQDFDIESLPWVEDQSEITVSLYDENGILINSTEDIVSGKEYEVVFKTEKPMAMYVNKSFGFEFLSETDREVNISDTHKYKVRKTEPGFKKVIFEMYPMYYQNDKLIHEKPQLFVFPKN